eukprot:TRINITY_DN2273_c0_g1_i2.p1 TRINITY_DN2273_c0_g1~~TRINITY_DN2273_c0_g1_i2.p1  ORF type:complete len:261 (-),score=-14.63 TRINITY_DN2273_c0_g1_i2:37-819(-)
MQEKLLQINKSNQIKSNYKQKNQILQHSQNFQIASISQNKKLITITFKNYVHCRFVFTTTLSNKFSMFETNFILTTNSNVAQKPKISNFYFTLCTSFKFKILYRQSQHPYLTFQNYNQDFNNSSFPFLRILFSQNFNEWIDFPKITCTFKNIELGTKFGFYHQKQFSSNLEIFSTVYKNISAYYKCFLQFWVFVFDSAPPLTLHTLHNTHAFVGPNMNIAYNPNPVFRPVNTVTRLMKCYLNKLLQIGRSIKRKTTRMDQ